MLGRSQVSKRDHGCDGTVCRKVKTRHTMSLVNTPSTPESPVDAPVGDGGLDDSGPARSSELNSN